MILEAIGEILLEVLLVFPGAFFRWIMGGCKKNYGYYLDSSAEVNVLVAIVVFAVVIISFNKLFS